MEEKKVMVFAILLLTIVVLGSSFFVLKNRNLPDSFQNKNSENDDYLKVENTVPSIENTEKEIIGEQNTSSDDNSEVSGGGGSASSNQDLKGDCLGNQITYSMTDFNKTSTCNDNQSDICMDKTVICSIEIKNRDSETGGFFELELTFAEAENQSSIVKKSSSRFFLEPGETNIFSDSANLQSTGEDGIANKNINCFFNTIEVPKKNIC